MKVFLQNIVNIFCSYSKVKYFLHLWLEDVSSSDILFLSLGKGNDSHDPTQQEGRASKIWFAGVTICKYLRRTVNKRFWARNATFLLFLLIWLIATSSSPRCVALMATRKWTRNVTDIHIASFGPQSLCWRKCPKVVHYTLKSSVDIIKSYPSEVICTLF